MAHEQLRLDLSAAPAGGRRSSSGRTLRRIAVMPNEAAAMLGVSRDFFDEHVKPELRVIRRGSRTILIPVAELESWVAQSAARWPA
jgi:hypothetical protein